MKTMPVSKPLAIAEEATLATLYEGGEYQQALSLIDSGLLALLNDRPDDPDLAGSALLVANLYRDLGRYTAAEAFYLQALAGLAAAGKDRPGYARGLADLAALYEQLGRYPQALELYASARAIHEAAEGPDPAGHARCLQEHGCLLDLLGHRREAVECLGRARGVLEHASANPVALAGLLLKEAWVFCRVHGVLDAVRRAREALEIYRRHVGERHPGTAQARHQLGRLLVSLFQLDEAEALLEASATWFRESQGEESPRHTGVLESLAMLRLAQGEPRQAEALARRALDVTTAGLGDGHLWAAQSQQTLGHVLLANRRLADAAECFERAYEIVQERLGQEHPCCAEIQLDLAEIREVAARHHEAIELTRAALATLERHPDDVRFERVGALLALARLTTSGGELKESADLAARASVLAADPGPDPFLLAPALLMQSQLHSARGESAAAARLLDEADRSLTQLPAHHPLRAEAASTRAGLAWMQGDPQRGVRLATDAARRLEQAEGERSPSLPAALRFLADQQHQAGDLAAAESSYERAFDLQKRRLGREHPDLAVTLRGLARLHLSRGNQQAANVRFRQALEIRQAALGHRHPDTAESLVDLAALAHQCRDLAAAEILYRKAIEVRAECLGESHPDTAAAIHGLATVVWSSGDAASSADLIERALAPLEEGHPQREALRHTLALMCNSRGEAGRALQLLGQVRAAYEKAVGEDHDGLVLVLGDLARIHSGLGDHLEARELLVRIHRIHAGSPIPQPFQEALDLVNLSDSYRQLNDLDRAGEVAQRALGLARSHLANEPGLFGCLTHCSRVCRGQRRFRTASRLLAEAEQLVRRAGGDQNAFLASVWSEQGAVAVARGRPRQATPLYERAAELARLTLGEDHPDHAATRRLLGLHLQSLAEYEKAEQQLRRYLEIVRRTAGPDHPGLALAIQLLAGLYHQRGDLASAEAECRKALELIRLSEQPVDAIHASGLHALAVLQRLQGRLAEAEELLNKALEIDRESASGEAGNGHLDTQAELALVEAARGKFDAAQERFLRVLAARESLAGAFNCLPPGPGRDALLAAPWNLVEQVLTLALSAPSTAGKVFDFCLRWHALMLGEFALGERATLRRRQPANAKELDRLIDLNLQIAGRLINGAGPDGLQMHRDFLARWGQERERLEEHLSSTVPQLARLRAWHRVDAAGVRAALPPGGALVELVRFRPRDFAEMCAGREGLLPARCMAFVVKSGNEGVAMIDVGSADALEGRDGADALRAVLATHLAGCTFLVAGSGGRLKRVGFKNLVPAVEARVVRSGREITCELLESKSEGWLERLKGWLGV
jgi:tetratricopeptide (TPR) repeat protein